jgi:hypothetical protein
MTSKQIREAEYSTPLIWLQEIAYQLALVNEANELADKRQQERDALYDRAFKK